MNYGQPKSSVQFLRWPLVRNSYVKKEARTEGLAGDLFCCGRVGY